MKALELLQEEAGRLENDLKKIRQAIAALGTNGNSSGTGNGKRRMSAASRAKIAAGQRKRWAVLRGKAGKK